VSDALRKRIDGVRDLVVTSVDPEPDIMLGDYRRHLAGVLTVRALREAAA